MWPLEQSTGWSLGHSAHPLTTVDTATLNNTPAGTAVLYTCKPRLDSGHSVSTTVMHSACVSCVHRIIYLLTFNISICQYIEFQFMRTVCILVNLSPVQHYCTVQGADVKITPNLPLLPVPARVVNLFSNWSFIFVGDYVSASLGPHSILNGICQPQHKGQNERSVWLGLIGGGAGIVPVWNILLLDSFSFSVTKSFLTSGSCADRVADRGEADWPRVLHTLTVQLGVAGGDVPVQVVILFSHPGKVSVRSQSAASLCFQFPIIWRQRGDSRPSLTRYNTTRTVKFYQDPEDESLSCRGWRRLPPTGESWAAAGLNCYLELVPICPSAHFFGSLYSFQQGADWPVRCSVSSTSH